MKFKVGDKVLHRFSTTGLRGTVVKITRHSNFHRPTHPYQIEWEGPGKEYSGKAQKEGSLILIAEPNDLMKELCTK